MKKPLFFSIILLMLSCQLFNASAQSWQWAAAAQGGGEGFSVVTDAAGNSFVSGYNEHSTITFGSITLTLFSSAGLSSTVLAKYDPAGNFLWVRSIQPTSVGNVNPIAMTTDANGNVYMAVFYSGVSVNVSGTTITNPTSGIEMLLAKYTPSGSLVFAMNLANTNFGSFSMVKNAGMKAVGGHVYITGTYEPALLHIGPFTLHNADPTGSQDDVFLCKMDTLGNFVWAKGFGGPSLEQVTSMDVTKNENIYIIGQFQSPTIAFGTGSITRTGPQPIFLAKYDSSGNPIWGNCIGGQAEIPSAVVTDTAGDAYITGSFNSPLTFGTTTLSIPTIGSNLWYQFLAKYDATGSVLWAKEITETGNNNFASSAAMDACGHLWVSGMISKTGSVSMDGHILPAPAGSNDPIFIAEYSSSGAYMSNTALPTGGDDVGGIAADPFGNIFIGGDYMMTTLTLGSSTLHDPTGAIENIFVAKFGAAIDTTYAHTDTCIAGSAVLSVPTGYRYYTWYDGSTGTTDTVSATGTYWVKATGGCPSGLFIDTFNVSVGAMDTLYKHTDTTLCSASSLVLNGPGGYLSYVWSDGSTAPSLTAAAAGTYWVIGKGGCTMPTTVDTFNIAINNTNISFSLGNDTTACSALLLQVPVTGGSYLWQDGSKNNTFLATQSGTYSATVTEHGCSYTDSIQVTIVNLTQHLRDTIVCREHSVAIPLTANVPTDGTVLWSNGSNQSSIIASDTGRYWVSVHAGGCQQNDTMTLQSQVCDCNAALPDAFSPNSDGRNDYYYPIIDPGCNVAGYSLMIYNRWGQQVFSSTDPAAKWDGKLNGTPAELGVYMYYLKYTAGPDRTVHALKGDITLVR